VEAAVQLYTFFNLDSRISVGVQRQIPRRGVDQILALKFTHAYCSSCDVIVFCCFDMLFKSMNMFINIGVLSIQVFFFAC
jgi:hypothetical protein